MTHIFEIVLDISIGASILALLILGARSVIGRKRVVLMPVLFALLIAKLIFPLSVESPLSIQNLINPQNAMPVAAETRIETPLPSTENNTVVQEIQTATEIATTDESQATTYNKPAITQSVPAATTAQGWQPSAMDIAAIVWLAGIIGLTAFISACNIRFTRLLKRNRAYTAPGFDALLKACKNEYGIRQTIQVIQVSKINTAAVYGIFKPKLLISPHTFDMLSVEEKRHVLMHELSHIKRRDTLTCLIITALNVVYWFNPIIWITFILMRKDLEVLCDASVLKKIGQSEKRSYATTLLNLIKANRKKNLRLTAALFMHKSNIKRRIVMISKYEKSASLYTALALVLTVVIAVTGCTTSVTEPADTTDELPQTEQPEQTEPITADEEPQPTELQVVANGELIGSHVLDISDYPYDEDRAYNIDKTISLLDGLVIPSGKQVNFLADEDVTAQNGWKTAPAIDWLSLREWETAPGITHGTTQQVGGGIELVSLAVFNGAFDACLDRISDKLYVSMVNWYVSDVTIHASVEDNNIIVNFYCPNNTFLDQRPTGEPIQPVLMTSYDVDYSSHNNENAYFNIEKAANALNGTVIAPGQEFSLNELLGPRNRASGWKQAGGISGGAYTAQYGGGISAVSSGLYNAAIRAELEIMEKVNHSIISDYIPLGLDATVSTDKPDLVIKNPYDIDVTIKASFNNGIVTIDVFGPPMDYTVDFTSMKTGTTPPPDTIYHYNATLTPDGEPIPHGEAVEWVKSREGSIYEIYKTKYDLDGNEIETSLFETVTYRWYTGQIYVNQPDPVATPKPSPQPTQVPVATAG